MITVWGRTNSTNVKKVRWCLAELGMDYQLIETGGNFGGNHSASYLAMNPNGLVPCLKDSATDLVLWESNAIVRYLAAQYGQPLLWPESAAERACGDKWMDWVCSSFTAPFRGVFISLVRTAPEARDAQLIARSTQECQALFAIMDAALAHQPWLSGEQFGPGDIAAGPTLYGLLNLEVDWGEYPHLQRWYQQLTRRPAFRETVMLPLS